MEKRVLQIFWGLMVTVAAVLAIDLYLDVLDHPGSPSGTFRLVLDLFGCAIIAAAFALSARHLRARLRREEALRAELSASEQMFRQLAENIGEVFYVANPDLTKVYYVSPAYERIWGRPCREIYERPKAWLDLIHPDDRALAHEGLAEMAEFGSYDQHYRIVRDDGTERHIRDRCFPTYDANGKLYRTAGIAEDLTLVKLAEESARAQALERETDRRHAREELLAIVSHDLRNPLNAIAVAAQALDRGELGPREKRRLRGIENAVARMDRLIGDLLDLSTIETGNLRLAPTHVGVDELLAGLQDTFPSESLQVELSIASDPGIPEVVVDRHRLLQVLSNLVGNAIKFTPAGGRVEVTAHAVPGGVDIAVADTGQGIDSNVVEHLFDKFWQGKSGDARGVGLGLAIVKGIVEAHGGSVNAVSEPGHGSVFTVRLPLSSPGLGSVDTASSAPSPAADGARATTQSRLQE